jgi:hypothetical protein
MYAETKGVETQKIISSKPPLILLTTNGDEFLRCSIALITIKTTRKIVAARRLVFSMKETSGLGKSTGLIFTVFSRIG